jgi:flagellin-specific chaperone FliS
MRTRVLEAVINSLDSLIKKEGSLYERLIVASKSMETVCAELNIPKIRESTPEEIREQVKKVAQLFNSLDTATDQDKLEEVVDEIILLYDLSKKRQN